MLNSSFGPVSLFIQGGILKIIFGSLVVVKFLFGCCLYNNNNNNDDNNNNNNNHNDNNLLSVKGSSTLYRKSWVFSRFSGFLQQLARFCTCNARRGGGDLNIDI